jgi:hypothetical protein
MAAHKLVNMIDPARAKLVFELLHRDIVHVAIAQAVERCAHYATLDPNAVPAKGKKRYGITITAPNGKAFETVRVTPQLLATAFSETYRSLRAPMQCNSQHDFLFYMQGLNIVDTDTKRYTLAVDGNRFILKVTGTPFTEALADKTAPKKPAAPAATFAYPKIVRTETGDLTPATRRAFRDLWNSMLEEAKEPLATLSENCMLKTPRYLANVTRVEIGFGHGRDKQQFNLAYVAKGAIDGSEPRTLGKLFPVTAQGIADAIHALRIRCPLPAGNVAAKPPKADGKLPKPETKKQNKPAPKSASKKEAAKPAPKPAPKKPVAKPAPKKPEAAPVPAPFTTDRDTTGATASAPKADA